MTTNRLNVGPGLYVQRARSPSFTISARLANDSAYARFPIINTDLPRLVSPNSDVALISGLCVPEGAT
ncbi:MAG: hypothetical protein N3G20_04810, partial [Verrucomicrobiae bacterium]|nr:hypothetical protein [Verrucomicrobiae bacterium]